MVLVIQCNTVGKYVKHSRESTNQTTWKLVAKLILLLSFSLTKHTNSVFGLNKYQVNAQHGEHHGVNQYDTEYFH